MSDTPNNISPSETITRYIMNKRYYSPTTLRVKHPVFMPYSNPGTLNFETSVYRTTTLTCTEIWTIGLNYVQDESKHRLMLARADLAASDVFNETLQIEPDTVIHPLHANIIGWPEEKHRQMLHAKKMAQMAKLHIKP